MKRPLCNFGWIAAFAFIASTQGMPVIETPPSLSTADITTRVEARVREAPGGGDIQVVVEGGHVRLSGSVPSAYHRDRLVEQVEKVRGVTRVTAKLDIRPESRTDAEIERDAQAALAYDSDTREIAVDVEARDGVVTLRGSVKTGGQRAAVEDVVKTVRGVHEIENHLELAASDREDHEIERDVQIELAASVVVEDPIEVLVENGEVMLSGTVDSLFERSWAVRRAWSVNGVRGVDARDIKVNPLQWNEDEPTPPLRSDARIVQAIVAAFYHDPTIQARRPIVGAEGGTITLSGTVQTIAAKRRAAQIAGAISGVEKVRNDLIVSPAEPVPDAEIERRVQSAFERSVVVEGNGIEVAATDGRISLSGSVDSTIEKEMAEELAAETRGAVELVSELVVRPDPEYVGRQASAAE